MFVGPTGDMYKSGSIYGFDRVGLAGAGVTEKGTWNDYEIRVVDQHSSIYRNGVLINEFGLHRRPGLHPAALGRPARTGAVRLRLPRTPGARHDGTWSRTRDVRIKEPQLSSP